MAARVPRLSSVAAMPATRVSSMFMFPLSAWAIIRPSSEISALVSIPGESICSLRRILFSSSRRDMPLPCLPCGATGTSNSLDITFTFSSITLVVPDALGLAKEADKGQQFSIWRKPGAGCTRA